jgi:hypothetical protein
MLILLVDWKKFRTFAQTKNSIEPNKTKYDKKVFDDTNSRPFLRNDNGGADCMYRHS